MTPAVRAAHADLPPDVQQLTRTVHDPGTYVDGVPYDALARLRRDYGVVPVLEPALPGWPEGSGYWLVLRYREVENLLKDPATYSSALGGTQIRDPRTPADLEYVRRMMLNMDPPEHSRLRRMLARSFTPRAVRGLEEQISGHVRGIVDRMMGDERSGECDFAKDVAADLPLLALADVLGVPAQDRWLLFDWSNRVIGWQDPDYAVSGAFDPSTGTDMARAAVELRPQPDADGLMPDPRSRSGMPDLYAYAHLLGAAKQRASRHDVMSILMAQRDTEDGRVSVEEFENMFWLFAVAGNETLRNGLPGGMIALLQHPQAQRALRADLSLLPRAVEEMLRWWTPVMTFRRTVTRDATLAGVAVQRGDKVVVSFAAANRDEAVFEEPDRFAVERGRHGKVAAHLSFGHGPHFCLGANLARVQMQALFRELLSRTSWLDVAGEPVYLRSHFQRGVKRLPMAWRR